MSLLFLSGVLGGCVMRSSEGSFGTDSDGSSSESQALLPSMEKLDRTQLKRKAEEALKERYGVSCEADYVDPLGDGPFSGITMRVTLRTPAGDEVLVDMDEKGGNVRDNYPLTWMRPQAEEKAAELAKEIWPSASGTVELSAAPFDGEWANDMALTDIFAGAGIIAQWEITVPEEKSGQEEAAADFSARLYDAGLYGRMSFIFTDGEVFLHGTKESQPTAEEIRQAFNK